MRFNFNKFEQFFSKLFHSNPEGWPVRFSVDQNRFPNLKDDFSVFLNHVKMSKNFSRFVEKRYGSLFQFVCCLQLGKKHKFEVCYAHRSLKLVESICKKFRLFSCISSGSFEQNMLLHYQNHLELPQLVQICKQQIQCQKGTIMLAVFFL